MHWVLILAVLLCTTLAEKAPAEAADHPAVRAVLSLAAMLLAPALAATMSAVVIRGIRRDEQNWAAWLARFSFGQQLHAGVLVLLVGAICYGLAWPQVVRVNLGLGEWFLVDDLLILAPVYLPLLLSWAVFYDVDRAVHELTSDEEESASPGRLTYVLLHARHYLGLVLVPLLGVLAVFDAARLLSPGFMESPHVWLLAAPLMGLMIVLLPWMLASLWQTETLPEGELRTHLESVLRDCRLRVRRVLVWRTNGRMTNAAVSGLLPGMRYVFLTDRLLEALDDAEIAAVVRHEAAHVVRHHLLLRLLLLGLPVAIWMAAEHVAPQHFEQLSAQLTSVGISEYAQQSLLLPVAIALFALVGMGSYCKLLEFEADQFAAGDDPAAMIMALCKIHAETGGGRNRDGWLHPSIGRRVRWLRDCAREPALAARFRMRMALAAWGIGLAYAVCLGVWMLPV